MTATVATGSPEPTATAHARSFSLADQQLFAALSGDRNPMHLDAQAARRTQAGDCVVHGVHAALWALDCLAADGVPLSSLASLRVAFNRFIHLDQPVRLTWRSPAAGSLKAQVELEGTAAVTLTLKFGPRGEADVAGWSGLSDLAIGNVPDQPASATFPDIAGRLVAPAASETFGAAFPHACQALGTARISALALLSTLVGMICPGLHSVFSGFAVKLTEPANAAGLFVRTRSFDERFRLATIDISGSGVAGEVSAFERFAPVESRFADLAAQVTPGEFVGRRALIVGGSRGLGAATAKLIAAGGGQAVITYVRGAEEAEKVRAEIVAACGAKSCTVLPFDAARDAAPQLAGLSGEITHFYYFATPRIFRQSGTVFDPAVFTEFLRFYVDGFAATLQALLERSGGTLHALYPSSVAVADRPKQMTEYAMAKAAGEILCADMARAQARLTISAPRLPRILTDQTATVPPVEAADAVATMLPLLRAEA
ncbi:NAD(P)-dependent dehydrogenase, short-chain alcohol dehydrogenase family [Faunimonas pinastri]|uniref:NAD(P)-dependent dehydrogenase, short-chain alcohol dehydrogenase family n=1 Tax=Faunimonas pinastri TaxID=1855383 RepID=A0A1H9FGX7_9HYPH|nr:SDR family NAD(P)-dependent oxidoreductase [Faunimonas pinastri]SEQ37180.1 NAD(P)-dependent dehydrogenase, short-chain alcohol dehydrogenase family [Faunimonas pinastri]